MVITTKKIGLRNSQRGISGVLVLVVMVAFFAVAALAIDLSSLYVAKNEAQRAADAAALAAAESVKDAGYFANPCGVSAASMTPQATLAANAVLELNTVGGRTPVLAAINLTPPASVTPNPVDVRVQIVVSQAMPTNVANFIFRISSVTVSATATGDAYSSTRNPARCGARAGPNVGLLGTN